MLNENKQKLINDFSQFVEQLPEEQLDIFDNKQEDNVDLFTLFQEFIALKTEIKVQSRQFKGALDEFKNVFTVLEKTCTTLSNELDSKRLENTRILQEQRQLSLRPLLLDILDVRDRLEETVTYLETYKPRFGFGFLRKDDSLVNTLNTGQNISLRRIDQLLNNNDVSMIEVLGKTFDTVYMRAVAVKNDNNLPNGCVVSEVRKGFMLDGKVLRIAEVEVNKIN